MSSSDSPVPASLDKALADLMALQPETVAKKAERDAAIVALLQMGARPPGREIHTVTSDGVPTTLIVNANPTPMHSPYYGQSIKEACYTRLTLVSKKDGQTPKQIWSALAAAGFQSAHNDPAHAVFNALSRRATKHRDVLLVGGGKWGLKSWYTEAELEEIKQSLGGMPGRDSGAHREGTKRGMLLAKENGVKVGRDLFMTPEKVAEAERRLAAGESIIDIAKDWGISRQTLYTRFDRDTIARLRNEPTDDEKNAVLERAAESVPDKTRH